ncbi:MAG: SMI1/KNR4 family protein [Pseudomonadota bacterium]
MIEENWVRYVARCDSHIPGFRDALRPGAGAAELAAAEAVIGRALPEELKTLLRLNDGAAEHLLVVFPGSWVLNPAAEVAASWKIWADLHDEDYMRDPEAVTGQSDRIKQDEHFRLAWIPFAANGMGDSLCIDLDPGPAGQVGQIISQYHDEDTRDVLGDSLAEFLAYLVTHFGSDPEERFGDDSWDGIINPDYAIIPPEGRGS